MQAPLTERVRRVIRLRCPVCGGAPVFRGWLRGHQRCGACGYVFRRREAGYFLMAMGISYFATAAVAVATWFLLEFTAGVRSLAVVFWTTVVVAAAFSLWFSRYARLLWMTFDLIIDPPAAEDFQPSDPRMKDEG